MSFQAWPMSGSAHTVATSGRERPRRREHRRVDPFGNLLSHEIEVLYEGDGRQNRCPDADFGNMLFHLILAVKVRNARLSVGVADRNEDEMDTCCLGCVGGEQYLVVSRREYRPTALSSRRKMSLLRELL